LVRIKTQLLRGDPRIHGPQKKKIIMESCSKGRAHKNGEKWVRVQEYHNPTAVLSGEPPQILELRF